MTSDRCVKLSKADIKSFSEEQENVKTKKTLYDLKLFNEFHTNEDKRIELQEIPATELQQFMIKFVLGVRKKNGKHIVYIVKRKLPSGLFVKY